MILFPFYTAFMSGRGTCAADQHHVRPRPHQLHRFEVHHREPRDGRLLLPHPPGPAPPLPSQRVPHV